MHGIVFRQIPGPAVFPVCVDPGVVEDISKDRVLYEDGVAVERPDDPAGLIFLRLLRGERYVFVFVGVEVGQVE